MAELGRAPGGVVRRHDRAARSLSSRASSVPRAPNTRSSSRPTCHEDRLRPRFLSPRLRPDRVPARPVVRQERCPQVRERQHGGDQCPAGQGLEGRPPGRSFRRPQGLPARVPGRALVRRSRFRGGLRFPRGRRPLLPVLDRIPGRQGRGHIPRRLRRDRLGPLPWQPRPVLHRHRLDPLCLTRVDPGLSRLPCPLSRLGRIRGRRRPYALAIAALIVFRHRTNIGRLIRGTERKIGEKAS